MAMIPMTTECPIRDTKDGVCMCYPPIKCDELKKRKGECCMTICCAIRSAYAYGINVTETKYTNALTGKIAELQKTLVSLSEEEG